MGGGYEAEGGGGSVAGGVGGNVKDFRESLSE